MAETFVMRARTRVFARRFCVRGSLNRASPFPRAIVPLNRFSLFHTEQLFQRRVRDIQSFVSTARRFSCHVLSVRAAMLFTWEIRFLSLTKEQFRICAAQPRRARVKVKRKFVYARALIVESARTNIMRIILDRDRII